jgi:hypothetical protein
MMERLKKLQLKGFVAGVLISVLVFSATMVFANVQTVTRTITYGVSVVIHGQPLHLTGDNRAFTMGGTTFLPLRAVSEALDIPVDFNPATHTVYLGNRFAGQRQLLNQAAPFHDSSAEVRTPASVQLGGSTFQNVITYTSNTFGASATRFTYHNLNGQFRMLTGHVGRVDGSVMINATLNIYGDGQLLATHSLNANDLPVPISVFVEGVRLLRVEVVMPGSGVGGASGVYALQGFLE